MSRVTQNAVVFHIYLCPKIVSAFLRPCSQKTEPGEGGRTLLQSFFKLESGSWDVSLSWQHLLKVEAPLLRGLFCGFWLFFWACKSSHSEKLHFTIKNCFGVNFTMQASVPGTRSPCIGANRPVLFLQHNCSAEDSSTNTSGVQRVAGGSNRRRCLLHTCRQVFICH